MAPFKVGSWYYLNGVDDVNNFNHFVCKITKTDIGKLGGLEIYHCDYIDFKNQRRGSGTLDEQHRWLFTELSYEEVELSILLYEQ